MISRTASVVACGILLYLSAAAVAQNSVVKEPTDWPRFLGPTHNASVIAATGVPAWPSTGPRRLWEVKKGKGWSSPAIAGDRVVIFSREGDREVIECLHASD